MYKFFIVIVIFLFVLFFGLRIVGAKNVAVKNGSKISYHNGAIMQGTSNVYFIWYGCWNCGYAGSNLETRMILTDFVLGLGGSPYFRINQTYPDASGGTPNGYLIYGGDVVDASYSEGTELSIAAVERIITRLHYNFQLPYDPNGIYIVLGSSDIGSTDNGFCTSSAAPQHHNFNLYSSPLKFAFIGNAARCPEIAAPQFYASRGGQLPTPNANFAADAMASTIAHVFNTAVTNPTSYGWYDRNGLENADLCAGKFGSTYTTSNGARANVHFYGRDFLIEQNWVNTGRGYCGLAYP